MFYVCEDIYCMSEREGGRERATLNFVCGARKLVTYSIYSTLLILFYVANDLNFYNKKKY